MRSICRSSERAGAQFSLMTAKFLRFSFGVRICTSPYGPHLAKRTWTFSPGRVPPGRSRFQVITPTASSSASSSSIDRDPARCAPDANSYCYRRDISTVECASARRTEAILEVGESRRAQPVSLLDGHYAPRLNMTGKVGQESLQWEHLASIHPSHGKDRSKVCGKFAWVFGRLGEPEETCWTAAVDCRNFWCATGAPRG